MTARLRIVYHNLDVPFHGNRIRLYHESLPAFHVKRLTVGKVGIVKVNLLTLPSRSSPLSCPHSIVRIPQCGIVAQAAYQMKAHREKLIDERGF